MIQNADPLDALFTDTHEIDRKALATALHDYVVIDRETMDVRLLPKAEALNSRQRVLVLILAFKVAHLVDAIDDPSVTPKKLTDVSGIPGGTIRPSLADLVKQRLITKRPDGTYFVDGYSVDRAIRFLSNGDAV